MLIHPPKKEIPHFVRNDKPSLRPFVIPSNARDLILYTATPTIPSPHFPAQKNALRMESAMPPPYTRFIRSDVL